MSRPRGNSGASGELAEQLKRRRSLNRDFDDEDGSREEPWFDLCYGGGGGGGGGWGAGLGDGGDRWVVVVGPFVCLYVLLP
jgi:hypothetical protein